MKLPDGPRMARWLESIRLILHPTAFFHALQECYGDAFTLGDKKFPVVYLSHPQAIKELLTADPNLFNSPIFPSAGIIFGKHSIIVTGGKTHQLQRRLLMPPFHGERMRTYGQLICDITQQVMARWTIGQVLPINSVMKEITIRVILQAVFGLHQGQRYEQMRQLLTLFLDALDTRIHTSVVLFPALRRKIGSWDSWGQHVRLSEQIDQLLYSEIQERRQSIDSDRTDILTLLLMARDENGQAMTDVEIRDQLMTLLFAGYKDPANTLTWTLFWIHYHPEIKSKLKSEIATIQADDDLSVITRLPYLTAVCQETLRLNPVGVGTLPRILKAPLQIMDYQFNPGTTLIGCFYLTHHREDLYPQPKRFQPERFLERQFSPYEYFPFGGGDRTCIGMAFAMFEMKLILATILSHWQLGLAEQRPVKPVPRSFTLAPPAGLQMVVLCQTQSQKKSQKVLANAVK